MRQERFKMEREGLVEEGQEVEISEKKRCDRSIYISGRAICGNVRDLSYKAEDQVEKRNHKRNREDAERVLSRSGIR